MPLPCGLLHHNRITKIDKSYFLPKKMAFARVLFHGNRTKQPTENRFYDEKTPHWVADSH